MMQVFSHSWHVSLLNEYFSAVFMHICLIVSNLYARTDLNVDLPGLSYSCMAQDVVDRWIFSGILGNLSGDSFNNVLPGSRKQTGFGE